MTKRPRSRINQVWQQTVTTSLQGLPVLWPQWTWHKPQKDIGPSQYNLTLSYSLTLSNKDYGNPPRAGGRAIPAKLFSSVVQPEAAECHETFNLWRCISQSLSWNFLLLYVNCDLWSQNAIGHSIWYYQIIHPSSQHLIPSLNQLDASLAYHKYSRLQ